MKKVVPYILGLVAALLVGGAWVFLFCTALNVHNIELWILVAIMLFVFVFVSRLAKGKKDFGRQTISKRTGSKGRSKKHTKFNFSIKYYFAPIALIILVVILSVVSGPFFNATAYADILKVTDSDFKADLAESVGTDSIALMDTASAQMLGDREIGALSDVVSQFDVSYDYHRLTITASLLRFLPLIMRTFING